ncbi:N-acetylglucosamine-6-phosphate deacetylase [Aerococcaceae bacterium DSM 111020]|nr:N-acetylglucosamine-6-phosphate deacetylase [Aerococcaceae bacterium DSM 111020]
MKAYHAKEIILDTRTIKDAYLIIDNGTFQEITTDKPNAIEIVDYSDKIIAPGLVDTHIHGYLNHDVMDNSVTGLNEIAKGLLHCGVTSWLPTTLTDSYERILDVCQTIGQNHQTIEGAKIQGIFLEGPFFTEKYKGAQNANYMSDPSTDKLTQWHQKSNQLVNKIAIAPERNGVIPFIEYANSLEVHVALAHSDASYEEAQAAVEAGASIFIHTYNGMSGLHHREPGMVGAALTCPHCYAEVIADGHHVHPAAIDVVVKSRGIEETVLVTDCMRAGGIGEGESRLGEYDVIVKDGTATLKEGGNLAGSILELIEAVQHLVEWNIVDLPTAIRMASLNAAKSVGIESECGRIDKGYAADFIVIDEAGHLFATYLDGIKRTA